MIKKAFKTGLLVVATATVLTGIGGTGASAQGFGIYLGGLGIHTGYWGDGYYHGWARRDWRNGYVRYDGCPGGYVREGRLCYPTW